ncbi:hypothetical protein FQN52_008977 [Onygenales sp. PD_12]|nr:hypothetical protein FQN52_008977 [Onygenales sp. PD_12]
MISFWTLGLSLSALTIIHQILLPWALNIRAAKSTGIPYVIVPFIGLNSSIRSVILTQTWIKCLNALFPNPPLTSWRRLTTAVWPLRNQHRPFAAMKTDTLLTVAPGGPIMFTADPDVIEQVFARPGDFQKPIHIYANASVYGSNVLASEGAEYRRHRKLVSAAFAERVYKLLWRESVNRALETLEYWLGKRDKNGKGEGKGGPWTVRSVAEDTMDLTLNVFARSGMGLEEEIESYETAAKGNAGDGIVAGKDDAEHAMKGTNALAALLDNILVVLALPRSVLKWIPIAGAQKGYQGLVGWQRHMEETMATRRAEMQKGTNTHAADFLTHLVREQEKARQASDPSTLTEGEILSNLFIMFLAGHETTANSLHFTLVCLAMRPDFQKEVQRELDEIFKGRPDPSQWDLTTDYPRLSNSRLAVAVNEQMRLYNPIIAIPKMTHAPQQLTVNGKQVTLPAKTVIRLCTTAAARHPKLWPQMTPPSGGPNNDEEDDLEEFKPERWLKDLPQPASPTDPPNVFVPKRGSFVPFSDGLRACPGRRFAQTETLVSLALLLVKCSVELAVDEWASDEEVERMGKGEKEVVWGKAVERTKETMGNRGPAVSIRLVNGAHVPLRFVERGQERFGDVLG